MTSWHFKSFGQLTTYELYKILQLRNEVFVVEQLSIYQDCDDKDFRSHHLFAVEDDKVIAYSRILPPGLPYPGAASIGRVLTASSARGKNLGRDLLSRSLENVYTLYGKIPVTIGAQLYLTKFYESFSFIARGEIYLEDGIEHITMEKPD